MNQTNNMKLVQVRLADSIYKGLGKLAKEEGVSMTDILRKSIELYIIAWNYGKQGKILMYENPKDASRVEVLIPGIINKEL